VSGQSAAVSNTENLMLDESALMMRIGSCIDFKSAPVLERYRAASGIAELILEPQLTEGYPESVGLFFNRVE
jgi:hypothetical protein